MNRSELQAILDNPPPKSPYFRLPSVHNIVLEEEEEEIPNPLNLPKRAPNTVTSIWGKVNKMTDATKINFLANLLQFSSIDFDAMAKEKGIASGSQM